MTDVGYRNPPLSTRFQKGRSGNPKGRPKRRRNEPPYEAVLGQAVTIIEDGVEDQVTAAEAFLLHLAKRGVESGGAAARIALAAIEEAREKAGAGIGRPITAIVRVLLEPTLTRALVPLRIATKVDPYLETTKVLLEPWIVEAALARFGSQRLTPEQQAAVVEAVRMASLVELRPASAPAARC
jgi:hypothetical protein